MYYNAILVLLLMFGLIISSYKSEAKPAPVPPVDTGTKYPGPGKIIRCKIENDKISCDFIEGLL